MSDTVVWLAETSGGEYSDSWQAIIDVYATADLAQAACLAYVRGIASRLRADNYEPDASELAERLAAVAAAPSWSQQALAGLFTADGEQPPNEAYAIAVPHTYGGPQCFTVTPYRVQQSVDAEEIAKWVQT